MSKQTQGLAAVMPSTEELKTAGIRELSAEELLEVNGGRQVEGAINPYGPDPDIPDDPPSSSGSSSDYSSGSSGGSSGSTDTSNDSSSDSGSSETSSGSSSNTSGDTSSSSSGSDTSDDNSSDSTSSSGSSSNASEDTSSSGSGSDTSNDSSSDSNNSSGSSSNASEDTSSSSSSSDSYEDEECGNYDNSSSDTGSNASENTSSNNSYSPDYEDEEPGSYDNSCNNPDAGSSDSSSSSSSYPDKDNNDSYAKNHSESSSGNSAETNRKGEAYIVQKGDTLSDIVRRHYPDASSDEIRRLVKETAKNSGITDVNKLEIGQTVFFTERQDGAKTGTKQAEAETKTQSLKEQFKNISETGNTQAIEKNAAATGNKRSSGTIKAAFAGFWNGIMGKGGKKQESVGQEETSLKHDDIGRESIKIHTKPLVNESIFQKFAKTQENLVGTKYVYGAENPLNVKEGGVDCSGALYYGLRTMGYILPYRSNAHTFLKEYTKEIERTQIMPGDLRALQTKEGRFYHVQTLMKSYRINPSGDETNTQNNPGIVEKFDSPLPTTGVIRRLDEDKLKQYYDPGKDIIGGKLSVGLLDRAYSELLQYSN